ncbi:tripartite tricarboxylate transporter TctB family protein [Ancylobacter oerskovii]|uniref:Tripartite tricarboxylate transporter TctB family protein n=1 Tax=Ancylobacter oerskovii TaxID=459519 RepID=A0ABW4Z3U2_9HYPH|nr:tripartite tricarboxylate transporter TctB family protein [Ancylobacter oerskovii]MBS7546026.1 tripartite tricarboxylate transporter TctB family protein [Ancylobacter oerskovii]
MGRFIRSPKDVGTGLLLIALAAWFAWLGSDLPIGRAIRMGPGYFPLVLCGILAALGLIVLLTGLAFGGDAEADDEAQRIAVPWRGILLVTLSVVVFGLAVAPLGLGPAMGLAVFISSAASRRFSLPGGALMAIIMVAFAWAVFIKGLGLPLPMLGPWLGGY